MSKNNKVEEERERRETNLLSFVSFVIFACFAFLPFQSCARRSIEDIEKERRAAVDLTLTKLGSCVEGGGTAEDSLKLAIAGVAVGPGETRVRVVAYTIGDSATFDLPVYSLSRGRWLINERGRAYIVDEQCKEYKLKDRGSVGGQEIPQDGRIHLTPGQSFEAVLKFPQLSDQARMGILVYGGREMSFLLPSKQQ